MDDIKKIKDLNKAYKYFLNIFIDIYDQLFLKSEVKVKFKSDQSPWITKGIAKSSKKKQRLYEKFLRNRNPKNQETYKTCKNYLKLLKGNQRKNFAQKNYKSLKIMQKKTWIVMKEILGKCTTKSSTLPTKTTVNKTDIFHTKK